MRKTRPGAESWICITSGLLVGLLALHHLTTQFLTHTHMHPMITQSRLPRFFPRRGTAALAPLTKQLFGVVISLIVITTACFPSITALNELSEPTSDPVSNPAVRGRGLALTQRHWLVRNAGLFFLDLSLPTPSKGF